MFSFVSMALIAAGIAASSVSTKSFFNTMTFLTEFSLPVAAIRTSASEAAKGYQSRPQSWTIILKGSQSCSIACSLFVSYLRQSKPQVSIREHSEDLKMPSSIHGVPASKRHQKLVLSGWKDLICEQSEKRPIQQKKRDEICQKFPP